METIINNNNFQEILETPGALVIDFWATWCGPCRMLSPRVDAVAEKYAGKAVVAKCNVDDCEEIAAQFGIRSIPTLVFFKDGKPVDRTVGAVSAAEIEEKLSQLL